MPEMIPRQIPLQNIVPLIAISNLKQTDYTHCHTDNSQQARPQEPNQKSNCRQNGYTLHKDASRPPIIHSSSIQSLNDNKELLQNDFLNSGGTKNSNQRSYPVCLLHTFVQTRLAANRSLAPTKTPMPNTTAHHSGCTLIIKPKIGWST